MRRRRRRLLAALAASAIPVAAAHAHTTGHAFIMLLPTHLYVWGGALVVAASFALVALLPTRAFARAGDLRARLRVPWGSAAARRRLSTAASLLSLLLVLALVAAGFRGSRDPLANPLPLFVWSLWWIGFTYLHALVGDVWVRLNPWVGLYRLLAGSSRRLPLLPYPRRVVGHWPAVLGLLAFAWFELIYPAPADPAVLAVTVTTYLVVHLLGAVIFGEPWLRHAESFAVFFRVISWLAPVGGRAPESRPPGGGGDAADGDAEIALPGLRLLSVPAPDASAVVFILLALSSVTFDGLSWTFWWLARLGENPLEHPGRTALMLPNTFGLLGVFATLALAYVAVAWLADALAGPGPDRGALRRALVLSIVPIAFGYHFAHYLPVFLVDVQYAWRAVSDPFALGWDLLGARDRYVVTSFLVVPPGVYAIWRAQVAIIVVAHIAAVYVAHVLALRAAAGPRAAALSQLPMLLLMIAYTLLGLWLLSTPRAA